MNDNQSTALATANPQSRNLATQWCEPSLPGKLSAELNRNTGFQDLTLPTREEADELWRFIAEGEALVEQARAPMEIEDFEVSLGTLAIAFPTAAQGDDEAMMRIEVYANALSDLPAISLKAAMKACVRECRFFPSVAEIRERATFPLAKLEYRLSRARMLLRRVENEGYFRDGSDAVKPEELAAMKLAFVDTKANAA